MTSLSPQHPLAGVQMRREILNIKASTIAKHLQVTPAYYSKLERGERPCYLHRAKTIAKLLGCTTDELERPLTTDEHIAVIRAQRASESPSAAFVNDINKTGIVVNVAPTPYHDGDVTDDDVYTHPSAPPSETPEQREARLKAIVEGAKPDETEEARKLREMLASWEE